jgi:hypothetical protein
VHGDVELSGGSCYLESLFDLRHSSQNVCNLIALHRVSKFVTNYISTKITAQYFVKEVQYNCSSVSKISPLR